MKIIFPPILNHEQNTNLSSAKGIETTSMSNELAGATAEKQCYCMHSQLLNLVALGVVLQVVLGEDLLG